MNPVSKATTPAISFGANLLAATPSPRVTFQANADQAQFQKQAQDKPKKEERNLATKLLNGLGKGFKWWALPLIPAVAIGLPLTLIGLPAGGIPAVPGLAVLFSPLATGTLGFLKGFFFGK